MRTDQRLRFTIRGLLANMVLCGIAFAAIRTLNAGVFVSALILIVFVTALISGNYGVAANAEHVRPWGDRLLVFFCYAGMVGIVCFAGFVALMVCISSFFYR